MGDFNIICYDYDKSGNVERKQVAISEFEDCLQQIDVDDLPFKSYLLTWCNGRFGQDRFYCKLDRILCNEKLMQLFPHKEAELLDLRVSDHCVGLLTIKKDFNFGPKPFKFHGFLMSHNDFP